MNIEEGIRRVGHVLGISFLCLYIVRALYFLPEFIENFKLGEAPERIGISLAISIALLLSYSIPVLAAKALNWIIRGFREQE